MKIRKGCLAELAVEGAELRVRVTPGAGREAIERDGDALHVRVTARPEAGAANDAVRKLLARALGIAPGRVSLVRGAHSREKLWRVD